MVVATGKNDVWTQLISRWFESTFNVNGRKNVDQVWEKKNRREGETKKDGPGEDKKEIAGGAGPRIAVGEGEGATGGTVQVQIHRAAQNKTFQGRKEAAVEARHPSCREYNPLVALKLRLTTVVLPYV